MDAYELKTLPERLKGNPYVGRGIVSGKTADRKNAAVAYFIMGRSENSRNRVFAETEDGVEIRPFDPSKVKDPSLIIYSPVRTFKNNLIVTNGDQTDTVCKFLENGKTFIEALETRAFEPDAPHYTPRVSGILTFEDRDFFYQMNILKPADAVGTDCLRQNFYYPALPGVGHFLHTYKTDGNPLPPFTGEPKRVSIPDSLDVFADSIWDSLDANNRVSLYVRYVDVWSGAYETRIINRNK